jgi:hypothetical protein
VVAALILSSVLGCAGLAWCVLMLAWSLFRNDAKGSVIYGVAVFGGAVVALNVGGALDAAAWSVFGAAVFAAHLAWCALVRGSVWGAVVSSALLTASILEMVV